jgi:hypothetical protein
MASPNPYASPETPRESDRDERFVRRYLPLLATGLLIGCGITAFNWMFGVPLTLFAMPALLRGTRIYWRRHQTDETVSAGDWALLTLLSLFAVIPISLVGLFAFCCVCTPTGFLMSDVAFDGRYGLQPNLWFAIPLFLGLTAGLSASLLLLTRLRYLSRDEKQALEQAASGDAAADDPPASD